MGQLERRAEEISGELNSQDVENMKLFYGMMGTQPGELMILVCSLRAKGRTEKSEKTPLSHSSRVWHQVQKYYWTEVVKYWCIDIIGDFGFAGSRYASICSKFRYSSIILYIYTMCLYVCVGLCVCV
jgi:hypothetical protein